MPTNRKRKARSPKSRVPAKPSKEYLQDSHVKDFLGELTPDEAAIAKRYGFYRWNGFVRLNKRLQSGEISRAEYDRLRAIEKAEVEKWKKPFCPECFSDDVLLKKTDHTAPSFCVIARHCRACGHVRRETGAR